MWSFHGYANSSGFFSFRLRHRQRPGEQYVTCLVIVFQHHRRNNFAGWWPTLYVHRNDAPAVHLYRVGVCTPHSVQDPALFARKISTNFNIFEIGPSLQKNVKIWLFIFIALSLFKWLTFECVSKKCIYIWSSIYREHIYLALYIWSIYLEPIYEAYILSICNYSFEAYPNKFSWDMAKLNQI